ncbi:MAG: tetratricopeptide repeat protein [Deltaproteobacteria bacterium]|nr:tetratricopeptide repeat protein [Deltaproteobacteria bacterium]
MILVLALLGAVLLSTPAQAISPYDDVLVQKAAKDLQQENYDEALAGLTEAWQKGTHTPEKAFLLAQTYRQMLNYPKAKEYLEETLRLNPNLSPAQLMLADTLLALDRPKEALPILQSLEASGFEPGQVAFLRGMIETKEGRYNEALDYFRKAQEDPRLAQEAKFQASLALAALNRLKEARKTMEEAISINTQSQTADFANRYMGILEKRLDEIKPFRATVTAGFDYDSNVTLQPGGAGAATQVSGHGDAVFAQSATFEYNLHAQGPFSLLTQYSYFQNFHPTLGTFDIMSHYVGAIPTYTYKSGRVWLPASYNYVDVASDKYFTGFLANPTWLHLFTENVGVETTARFARRYYWTPLSFAQDDRSGKDVGGSLGAYYFIQNQKGYLQARLSFDHDATTGSNWDSDSYRLLLAALYPITDKLKANAFVDLSVQPYEHLFFNGAGLENKRFDKILVTGLQFTYQLPKGFDFNVHYFFTRDNSNTALYTYSRHIVGCQIGYRY